MEVDRPQDDRDSDHESDSQDDRSDSSSGYSEDSDHESDYLANVSFQFDSSRARKYCKYPDGRLRCNEGIARWDYAPEMLWIHDENTSLETTTIEVRKSIRIQSLRCDAGSQLIIYEVIHLRELIADQVLHLSMYWLNTTAFQCLSLKSVVTIEIQECKLLHLDIRHCSQLTTIVISETPLQTLLLPLIKLDKISIHYTNLVELIHPIQCIDIYLSHNLVLSTIVVQPLREFSCSDFGHCRLLQLMFVGRVTLDCGQIDFLEVAHVVLVTITYTRIAVATLTDVKNFLHEGANPKMKVFARGNIAPVVTTNPIAKCIGCAYIHINGMFPRNHIMSVSRTSIINMMRPQRHRVLAIGMRRADSLYPMNTSHIIGQRQIIHHI